MKSLFHLVSDSTGGTITAAANAALIQFPGIEFETEVHIFVRTRSKVAQTLELIAARPGPVIYTISDPSLRHVLEDGIDALGQRRIALLHPIIDVLSDISGKEADHRPGQLQQINRDYLDRVAAIDFALHYDDGQAPDYLMNADVILVGVSRTSKTPTCVYLAYQGIRAANVPLVPDQPIPEGLHEALRKGVPIIGLIIGPQRLAQIRRERLDALSDHSEAQYADLDAIREEVTNARLLYERHDIPVIDVTRRSIEETAATIRKMLADLRRGMK